MKLFGSYTSPFVRHCRIVLAEAGFDYEMVLIDHAESAKSSPTSRMPYFEDGEVKLFDSASIIHYLREKQGIAFLPTSQQTEIFALANTILDAHIDLVLLQRSGVTDTENTYIQRHHGRAIDSTKLLDELIKNTKTFISSTIEPENDATLRVACMLDWVSLRERDDITKYPNLHAVYNTMYAWELFKNTDPKKTK